MTTAIFNDIFETTLKLNLVRIFFPATDIFSRSQEVLKYRYTHFGLYFFMPLMFYPVLKTY